MILDKMSKKKMGEKGLKKRTSLFAHVWHGINDIHIFCRINDKHNHKYNRRFLKIYKGLLK
jgi:hypothetical protein